jgi:ketosteroid isomerase-like protein
MASNADRATVLVRALRASAAGDSSVVKDLFTADVRGTSPVLAVASAAELAVELEDGDTAFTDIELDVRPLDVAGECACVEWTVTATRADPSAVDDHRPIEPTGLRCTLRGVTIAEFEGDRIRSFRQYWDETEAGPEPGLLPST